jgi:hypothetical protein
MPRINKENFWKEQVGLQILWIDSCGSSLEGYVARYGAATDADKCGDGGEAIYRADMNYLEELTQKWNRAMAQRRR